MTLCDICSTPNPEYRYPTESFIYAAGIEGPIQLASNGDWHACQVCHDLIESGDARALTERAVDYLLAKHPDIDREFALDESIILHQQFLCSRKGEAVPV